jgi:flagellar motility protein MotE (MotC chaperone)
MDAQTAAGILSRLYDETWIAAVIYYMTPESAAQVMSFMSADLAARVTTELLKTE